ncbi:MULTISPECIES: hypothetical protein [Colwellia]|uniref:Uncharacterized protein n=1 Tax=Colwellia marinimaniae TaxID=1513592 RepID=A0ABQ0MYZ6_9GAMM|nr:MULTISPECIES: hypothetical protein [Colwellia]GAW97477.1 hypothetical protein MTCD1_03104 [Colwellia marinimaniae]
MSTFNMTKNTSSKIKDISLALVFIGSLMGVTLSTSVNATPASSIENAVSDFIVAQGEKMIAELNIQLQQSIEKEIKTFSANFSINNADTWLTADQKVKQATSAVNEKIKTVNKVNNQ